jgi:hypothetical protein
LNSRHCGRHKKLHFFTGITEHRKHFPVSRLQKTIERRDLCYCRLFLALLYSGEYKSESGNFCRNPVQHPDRIPLKKIKVTNRQRSVTVILEYGKPPKQIKLPESLPR